MLAFERRGQILEATERDGVVRVTDLVRALKVSDVTIRRDLEALVEQGLVEKVHGGARRRLGAKPTVELDQMGERTHIGVLLPSGADYFRRIVEGIQSAVTAAGARLTMSVSQYHPEREEALAQGLLENGIDGLLLIPSLGDDDGTGTWVSDLAVPAVLIERELRQGRLGSMASVRTAHEDGAAEAVHHLFGLGHRRIALITRGDSQVATLVREGWQRATTELQLPRDVPVVSGKDVGSWPRWEQGDVGKIVRTLRDADVTALLCHNDENALAIMDHARSLGWSVPEELSVVAYEDEIGHLSNPPLTAISPPKERVGTTAVSLLMDLIRQPNQPICHAVIEPTLVLRSSTAPADG